MARPAKLFRWRIVATRLCRPTQYAHLAGDGVSSRAKVGFQDNLRLQMEDNLLNASRLCDCGDLLEALNGTIRVNPDGTWYSPETAPTSPNPSDPGVHSTPLSEGMNSCSSNRRNIPRSATP